MARAGGLRPAKHTRVLALDKTLAGSPAARARLSRQLRGLASRKLSLLGRSHARSLRRTVPPEFVLLHLYIEGYFCPKR